MADKKISQLTGATTPLAGTEVLPIVQGGNTVKVAVSDLTAGRGVTASSITASNLTAGRVPVVGTAGLLGTSSNLLWDSGNSYLGIGVSPTYPLHVSRSSAGAVVGFRASDVSANARSIIIGNSQGDVVAASTTTGNGIIYSDSSKTMALGSNGSATARLTVETGGNVTVNTGNVVVGTAAKGIDFSANTGAAGETSSLLNWYEEGTWTPTLSGFTTSGTVTATGSYRRIGSIMYIRAQIAVSGGTTACTGGTSYLTGLPFIAAEAGGCATVNASTAVGYGVGSIQGNFIYPATWGATANTITIDATAIV